MKIISVVRDFSAYDRCVRSNPYLAGAEFVAIDNRELNEGIGLCYNRALEKIDLSQDEWVVFCHEDFEVKEDLTAVLARLDKNALWGPVGTRTDLRFGFYYQWRLMGKIEESDRNGNDLRIVGDEVEEGERVDVFDCQCLIIHSDLLRNQKLRFDECLTFDLYVEDFCIAAKERLDVPSRVVRLKCRHWSHGSVQTRYYEQLAYLRQKWSVCCYTGVSSYSIGGGGGWMRRFEEWIKEGLK